MRPLILALAFWLLASLIMLPGCTHHPDCLCHDCEVAYYQQREKDDANR